MSILHQITEKYIITCTPNIYLQIIQPYIKYFSFQSLNINQLIHIYNSYISSTFTPVYISFQALKISI